MLLVLGVKCHCQSQSQLNFLLCYLLYILQFCALQICSDLPWANFCVLCESLNACSVPKCMFLFIKFIGSEIIQITNKNKNKFSQHPDWIFASMLVSLKLFFGNEAWNQPRDEAWENFIWSISGQWFYQLHFKVAFCYLLLTCAGSWVL